MTAGERLRALAGVGGTAAALLLAIGSGVTTGQALVDYSGLPTGTAAEHLLVDARHDMVLPPQYGGSAEDRTGLFREHHDYLNGLREIQVQIADDMRGSRTISMRADMEIPDAILPPPMRGTVSPTRIADVLGNPLILAAMALLIDEADD